MLRNSIKAQAKEYTKKSRQLFLAFNKEAIRTYLTQEVEVDLSDESEKNGFIKQKYKKNPKYLALAQQLSKDETYRKYRNEFDLLTEEKNQIKKIGKSTDKKQIAILTILNTQIKQVSEGLDLYVTNWIKQKNEENVDFIPTRELTKEEKENLSKEEQKQLKAEIIACNKAHLMESMWKAYEHEYQGEIDREYNQNKERQADENDRLSDLAENQIINNYNKYINQLCAEVVKDCSNQCNEAINKWVEILGELLNARDYTSAAAVHTGLVAVLPNDMLNSLYGKVNFTLEGAPHITNKQVLKKANKLFGNRESVFRKYRKCVKQKSSIPSLIHLKKYVALSPQVRFDASSQKKRIAPKEERIAEVQALCEKLKQENEQKEAKEITLITIKAPKLLTTSPRRYSLVLPKRKNRNDIDVYDPVKARHSDQSLVGKAKKHHQTSREKERGNTVPSLPLPLSKDESECELPKESIVFVPAKQEKSDIEKFALEERFSHSQTIPTHPVRKIKEKLSPRVSSSAGTLFNSKDKIPRPSAGDVLQRQNNSCKQTHK